ncbi:MAG TPA: beta-ketoacyl synthase N-terminal-like domain-containing protein, partial [Myxococcaceae bacterium]
MSSSALMRRVLTLLKEGAISRSAAVSLLEAAREAGPEPAPSNGRGAGAPIAIIGLAARMPLADTADDFWKLLWNGVDCIRDLPSARVPDAEAHYAGLDEGEFLPGGRFWKLGYLEAIDRFDAAYFGIGRAEAALMDPAHRLFLEVSVEAFEDAGYHGRALQGSRTAVITGNPGYHYAEAVLDEPSATAVTGNVPEFLASRVAYLHDLTGPALGVQSTCASSLVAVHQACQWLRAGACDLALAGGATVFSFPGNVRSNPITASGITSEGQRCRPFARGADGIGRGEGIIAFVLKPLARALADGDAVRAVIRGGAINNDGRCAGLTAPNPRAHTALLLEAWRDAGVDPRALRYIEAHGTGTALGDPIEIKGITDAFASFTSVRQFCGVGAVKGNIGHLVDGAAGASGLLKLVLMLEHRALPPTIHFDEPNEQINFVESPVYVVDRPAPWPREDVPRLGGVSAFGFNGTNCHLVVEEAPESAARRERDAGRAEVLCLSARNDEALRALAGRLADRLEAEPGLPLDDVAHTLAVGRAVHDARLALVASDVPAAARALRGMLEPGAWRSRPEAGIWLGGSVPAPAAAPEAVIRPGDVPAAAQETDPLRAAARRFAISGEVTAREAQPGRPPRRVHLPTYPFQRERHWMRSRARGSRAPGATARAAPGEEVEAIWREVLGDGAGDDFYTSGGNSLLAGLVVSRIGARLGVEVPLSAFLGAPTRAALLGHVESRLQAPASRASQIPPIARGGDLPLSFAQERLWLLERLAPGSVAYNLPGTVRLRGRVDPAALSAALDAVVRRHEVLRAAFPSVDGRPTQVIHPEPQGRLEVLDLRADPDREAVARRRLAEVVQRPFDLERGPLLRAALARLGEDESLLHVDVHHLVADGWSLALLIREVATAYQALAAGKPPPWAPLAIQYADFAAWQRRTLGPEALGGPLERCRLRLEGAPDLLDLPTDFPRPRVESDRGAQHPIRLSRELVERLQRLARGEGATLYMVLLAAFELLLHRYAG